MNTASLTFIYIFIHVSVLLQIKLLRKSNRCGQMYLVLFAKAFYLETWLGMYVLARNAASGSRSVSIRRSRHFSSLRKQTAVKEMVPRHMNLFTVVVPAPRF